MRTALGTAGGLAVVEVEWSSRSSFKNRSWRVDLRIGLQDGLALTILRVTSLACRTRPTQWITL